MQVQVVRLAPHLQRLAPPPVPSSVGRVLLILDVNHVLCERHPSHCAPPSEAQRASHAHTQLRPGCYAWNHVETKPDMASQPALRGPLPAPDHASG